MQQPPDSEADPRLYMAAERTFLAWIRTGIALMGFGFVVARFGLFLREFQLTSTQPSTQRIGLSMPIGISLILFGIFVILSSTVRHRRYVAAIDRNQFRKAFGIQFAICVAVALSAIGLLMTVYLTTI